MARPLKDGVECWPFNTDFLTCDEIRLIRTQFGAKGVLVAIALINECYRSAGYFKQWDDDCCSLMADAVSCGITPELISQVLQECIRRSLFNDKVFSVHSVLTSAGIQRRHLRMLNNRNEIEITEEYWLLNVDSKKDVPASILNKIVLKALKVILKAIKLILTPIKVRQTHKVKKSKEKERKEKDICANVEDNLFDRFWAVYPKKRSKDDALKAFNKIKPSEELLADIIFSG